MKKMRFNLQYYYDKRKNAESESQKVLRINGTLAFGLIIFLWKLSYAMVQSLRKNSENKHISTVDIGMEIGIDHKNVFEPITQSWLQKGSYRYRARDSLL